MAEIVLNGSNLRHIYVEDDGAKFLRGEVATALCGFVAEGKGNPNAVEWCGECREKAGLARDVESW